VYDRRVTPARRRAIRGALSDLSDAFLELAPSKIRGPSLATGAAGIALGHRALGHAAEAEAALDRAVAQLGRTATDPTLFHGFTGVAWVAEQMGRGEGNEEIDEVLTAYLSRAPAGGRFDLTNGVAGIGVYALERRDARLAGLVLDALEAASERDGQGIAWRSPGAPEWNLGVAHGTPGVIGVCAGLAAHAPARAGRLVEGAVAWLLAREGPEGFTTAVGKTQAARLAWCYGDAGIAATLQRAADALGDARIAAAARRVARRGAGRAEAPSGVTDVGLCHGAAGLAHIFRRLHRRLGDVELGAAADRWLDRTLALRRPRGIGGFVAELRDRRGRPYFGPAPGVLFGAAGVALALAAALDEREGAWDRAFLISPFGR